jgi:hypothetical protein
MRYQQLLLTRYNVESEAAAQAGIDPFSSGWIEHRDLLFRRYCVASVRNQTYREFEWFVMFHPETPREYFDFLDGIGIVIFARTTKEAVGIIQRKYIRSDTVVSSRMDNDDAIAPDFMRQVQMTVDGALQSGFGGGQDFLVSFRNGIVAHAPSGRWRPHSQPSAPFLTLVEHLPIGPSWLSPLGVGHDEAPNLFPMISLDNKDPLWAFIVHERNISNHDLWLPSTITQETLRSFPQRFPRYRRGNALHVAFVWRIAWRWRRIVRWGIARVRFLVFRHHDEPHGQ